MRELLHISLAVWYLEAHRLKVVPTGMTTGLDIGLSNLSLKMITLSFYSQYFASLH
jgi:hypothetical protein